MALVNGVGDEEIAPHSEALRALEILDQAEDLPQSGRLDLVGVYAGVKPAAIMGGYYHIDDFTEPCELSELNYSVTARLIDLADRLGLKYRGMRGVHFAVSRHQAILDVLKDRHSNILSRSRGEQELRHRQIGRLVGYPDTAIDYFLYRLHEEHSNGSLPPSVKPDKTFGDVRHFANFVLSPNNMQYELESYARKLQQAAKYFTPRLYKQVVVNGERAERYLAGSLDINYIKLGQVAVSISAEVE